VAEILPASCALQGIELGSVLPPGSSGLTYVRAPIRLRTSRAGSVNEAPQVLASGASSFLGLLPWGSRVDARGGRQDVVRPESAAGVKTGAMRAHASRSRPPFVPSGERNRDAVNIEGPPGKTVTGRSTVLTVPGLLNIGAASRASTAPAPTLARGAPRAMVPSAELVAGDRAHAGAPYASGRGTVEHRGAVQ